MTEVDVYAKVKGLINEGNLVMARGKMLVPIPEGLLEEIEIVKLYITFNVEKKEITSEKANSIRGSMNVSNALKIWRQTLPRKSGGYCRLSQIDQMKKATHITIGKAFDEWMRRRYVEKSPETFVSRKKEFFKYMPQLSEIHTSYNKEYFKEGWCYEEHDGPLYNQYIWKYNSAVIAIKAQLDKITEK